MPTGRDGDIRGKSFTVLGDATQSLGLVGLTNGSVGSVAPSYTAAQIANLTNAVDGTIVYDTDNQVFMGQANGVFVSL